ncbi:dUTPase-like protein [Chiua virens]|nr:dUTPase-like protein [Chiua virens]
MTVEPQPKKRRMSDSAQSSSSSQLLVKRLSEKAKLPTRGSLLAAGAEKKTIPARGTYGRVAPRSGLASKFMIDTGAGVIDADYRGTVFVLLFNLSDQNFEVQEGDRIAQLVLEKICTPDVLEVENLDETLRGVNGFGSTGGHVQLLNSSSNPMLLYTAVEIDLVKLDEDHAYKMMKHTITMLPPRSVSTTYMPSSVRLGNPNILWPHASIRNRAICRMIYVDELDGFDESDKLIQLILCSIIFNCAFRGGNESREFVETPESVGGE